MTNGMSSFFARRCAIGAWKSSATLKIKSGFHSFANRSSPPGSRQPAEKYSALVSRRPSAVRLARPQIRFARMQNFSGQEDSSAIRLATAITKSSRSTKCRCSARQPPPQRMAGTTALTTSTRGFMKPNLAEARPYGILGPSSCHNGTRNNLPGTYCYGETIPRAGRNHFAAARCWPIKPESCANSFSRNDNHVVNCDIAPAWMPGCRSVVAGFGGQNFKMENAQNNVMQRQVL